MMWRFGSYWNIHQCHLLPIYFQWLYPWTILNPLQEDARSQAVQQARDRDSLVSTCLDWNILKLSEIIWICVQNISKYWYCSLNRFDVWVVFFACSTLDIYPGYLRVSQDYLDTLRLQEITSDIDPHWSVDDLLQETSDAEEGNPKQEAGRHCMPFGSCWQYMGSQPGGSMYPLPFIH